MRRQCGHVKGDGTRCGAAAPAGSAFCYFHDPEKAAARRESNQRGGRARSRRAAVLPEGTADLPLASMADVAGLLAATINQTRRGELDCRVANAVGYLAATLAKVLEKSDLETRIAALEAALAKRGDRR